jgi:YtcA family
MITTSVLLLALIVSTGCSRAPSFDILGSFFPAWLMCLAVGVALTAVARWLLVRVRVVLALPILTYPSLTVVFTLGLWFMFFR